MADYDGDRAKAVAAETGDARFSGAQVDASDPAAIAELIRADEGRTPFSTPATRGSSCRSSTRRSRPATTYLDMAMSLSHPHPDEPYAKTGVKLGDEQFAKSRGVGEARPARACRHRRRAGAVRRLRAVRRRRAVLLDRRARRARRRQPRRRGLRLRADVLDLDDDRGVPQPAGDLGEGPGLVHHRRRSASPRSSTSPRASARSSASTSSTRRCC